ncbi:hypothetical protein EZV62_017387 [Acer yangbiense]|uniref:Leucine-rich repeat-containing N-terminal plant-type domain-containing protein n=1 Tax=Acer yangbiense TaxID=1000413 RepID=A0A5C7HGI7_9ROSI|nr:hypothetical protein EZV62_017387 [Acer yangbiense]
MATRNSSFELLVLVILVLLTKSKFLEAVRSNSPATVDFNISCIEKEREALLQFKGALPTSVGNLSHLVTLDLAFNKMNGTIPETLGQLTDLEDLDLSGNSWEGVVTENHLQNLTRLTILRNNLSEELSVSLPDCKGLRANRLTGNIPEQLCPFPNLHILDLALIYKEGEYMLKNRDRREDEFIVIGSCC